MPWVVDLLKLALAPGLAPGTDLPTVLFYDEMESLNRTTWMGFERVLYIQDRCALMVVLVAVSWCAVN